MSNRTIPPPKPQRRPAPAPSGLFIKSDTVVPGYPRQSPPIRPVAPQVIERAREAARGSSPDLIDHRLWQVEKDVSVIKGKISGIELGQDRTVRAVEELCTKVGEWEIANSGAEITKIQEDQKTKRFQMIIGVLMFVCTTGGTIITNIAMRPNPVTVNPAPPRSANDIAIEACGKRPTVEAQSKCVADLAIANIVPAKQ